MLIDLKVESATSENPINVDSDSEIKDIAINEDNSAMPDTINDNTGCKENNNAESVVDNDILDKHKKKQPKETNQK